MSDVAKANLVVLWERELRIASEALKRVQDLDPNTTPKEWAGALRDAINACIVAIGTVAQEPDAQVVVCSDERLRFVPRVTVVKPEGRRGDE